MSLWDFGISMLDITEESDDFSRIEQVDKMYYPEEKVNEAVKQVIDKLEKGMNETRSSSVYNTLIGCKEIIEQEFGLGEFPKENSEGSD